MKKLIFMIIPLFLFGCGQNSTSNSNSTWSWDVVLSWSSQDSSYTMEDVKKHNKEDDCWTAINWLVYNLTSFAPEHKWWKEKIIALCGIDGSQAFNDQHGGQEQPMSTLKTYQIWVLK